MNRFSRQAGRVFGHAGAQAFTQLLSFITGVLIVRVLLETQYAQYSICVAVVSALAILTDSGIGATLMARGAQTVHDSVAFSGQFRIAMRVRRFLATPVLVLGSVWTYFLLVQNEAPLELAIICVILTIANVAISLEIGLLQVAHRVHLRLGPLRASAIGQASLRLGLVAVAGALNLTDPAIYLAILLLVSLLGLGYLRFAARPFLVGSPGIDLPPVSDYRRGITRTLPMVLLLIAGEQLFLGMISVLGNTVVLAQFSAMSRFGVVFLLLNSLVSDIAAPLIARQSSSLGAVLQGIGSVVATYVVAAGVVVGFVAVLAAPILSILGPRFKGLEIGLILVACGYAVYNVGYCLDYLSQARAWLSGSWVYAPLIVLWFAYSVIFLDLRDVNQVAVSFILQGSVFVITQLFRIVVGARSHNRTV